MDKTLVFDSGSGQPTYPFPMGNGGFFGNGMNFGDLIGLIAVASIFGWNNNGNGFGFGGNGNAAYATLNGDLGRQMLQESIQGNRAAIDQLSSMIGCSNQQLMAAVANINTALAQLAGQNGMSALQLTNAIQAGDNNLLNQFSACCCNILQSIERQGADTRLQNCQNMNALTSKLDSNTLALRDSAAANTNAVLAKLDSIENRAMQDKIAALTAENGTLRGEISQRNQNDTILGNVAAQLNPIVSIVSTLRSDLDSIKCKLPPTVPVLYPNIAGVNLDAARAAALGNCLGGYNGFNGGGFNGGGFWF